MSQKETRLLRDRALRNRSWAVLEEQLARVRADLSARSVGARAAETVAEEAREVADAGVSMARAHKGMVAGTIGALTAWVFRDHILRGINEITGRSDHRDDVPASQNGEPDRE